MAGTRGTNRARQGSTAIESPGSNTPVDNDQPQDLRPLSLDPPAEQAEDLDREEADLRARLARAEQLRRVASLRRDVAEAEERASHALGPLPRAEQDLHPLGGDPDVETTPRSRRHDRAPSDEALSSEPKRARGNDAGRVVKDPPEYSGRNQRQYHEFIRACELVFRIRPSQYDDDAAKINHALQYIKGTPADAWEREERRLGQNTASWAEFKDFLRDQQLDPVNRGISVAFAYNRAQQERGQTVHSFATYLDQLEADLPPKSEENRRLDLLVKLRPELQRAITNYQDIPDSRAALIVLATRLEENQKQAHSTSYGPQGRRNEESRAATRTSFPGRNSEPLSSSQRNSLPYRGGQRDNRPQRNSNRPRLSNEEYDRRRKGNLCFGCGQAGHAAVACPKQSTGPNSEPTREAPSTSTLSAMPLETLNVDHCLETQVELKGADGWSTRRALIDSGANVNLVSQICAKECGLDPVSLRAIKVSLPDGKTIQTFGSHTAAVKTKDDDGVQREEQEQFVAATLEQYDLILGMPWLRRHNPRVDWPARRWTYPNVAADVELVGPEQFEGLVGQGAMVYAAFARENPLEPEDSGTPGISLHNLQASELPAEYEEYRDVFSEEAANELPPHGPQDHAIDLEGGAPPFGPLYNLSANELEVLKGYIDENLKKGFITRSTSPAGAPILFVKKKDGGLRLCVDYRGLNRVTIKNRYPLPLIGEALDRLVGAKVYTKLDIRSAYNLIRIKEGDEWKTAFRTRYGHFEYRVLPFGLANAPATFQAYINKVLNNYLDQFCIVYLDDILIYSEDPKEHPEHVRKVLKQLRLHRLFAKLEKCEFHVTTVGFLGYTISPKGVSMESSRIASVQDWPEPRGVRDIQVFLGFANFYRRFVKGFSRVAAPLTDLLKGGTDGRPPPKFTMTQEARDAFAQLKKAFTSAPMLVHYDPEERIRVETDASGFAVSAILSQPHQGVTGDPAQKHWHPVAFWSRKMTSTERNYETHDAELLAIVASFQHWRHYLEGAKYPIKVLTDHANLRYIGTKALTRRQARWSLALSAYDFELEYRPGASNPADGPSRRPDYLEEDKTDPLDRIPTLQVKLQRALRKQRELSSVGESGTKDESFPGTGGPEHLVPRLAAARAALAESPYDDPAEDLMGLLQTLQGDDILARRVVTSLGQVGDASRVADPLNGESTPPGESNYWSKDTQGVLRYKGRVYVPNDGAVRAEILKQNHDNPLAGHFGRARTTELVTRKYYWPGLTQDVKDYVQGCDVCQRSKAPRHKPHGILHPLPVPSRPLGDLTMDFITGLPPSRSAGQVYDSILVIVDRYTKLARYIAVRKTIDAPELASVLLRHWIKDYGLPDSIVSDRGSVFTAKFWSSLCYILKIKRRLSTAFHPQTDGQTERQNQTLEQYLRIYVNHHQDDWANLLPMAEFSYNNSFHASLKASPFYALMGINPSFDPCLEPRPEDAPAAIERAQELQELRGELAVNLETARTSQASYYDQHRKPKEYQVGDLVWINAKNIRTSRPSRKLDFKQLGPYKVVEAVGPAAYRLELPSNLKALHHVFPVNLLEPFTPPATGAKVVPPPVEIDAQEEYHVDRVLDSKKTRGRVYYLVRWTGYGPNDDSWEPIENLSNAREAVLQFHREHPSKPRAPRGHTQV